MSVTDGPAGQGRFRKACPCVLAIKWTAFNVCALTYGFTQPYPEYFDLTICSSPCLFFLAKLFASTCIHARFPQPEEVAKRVCPRKNAGPWSRAPASNLLPVSTSVSFTRVSCLSFAQAHNTSAPAGDRPHQTKFRGAEFIFIDCINPTILA